MSRTGQQRLDAIVPAIERRDAFRERVTAAEGDAVRCADLMAEAISMKLESNGIETVGRNGKVTVSMENVCASHCLIYARDAYLKARSATLLGNDGGIAMTGEWQPIETAPENTDILTWSSRNDECFCVDRFHWVTDIGKSPERND